MEGRGSSAIHRVNNDPGTSAIKKCEYSGIELSSRTKRALSAADRDSDYHRNYSKRSEVVKHKLVVNSKRIQAHSEYKQSTKVKSDYRKGQLDHIPSNHWLMELIRSDFSNSL